MAVVLAGLASAEERTRFRQAYPYIGLEAGYHVSDTATFPSMAVTAGYRLSRRWGVEAAAGVETGGPDENGVGVSQTIVLSGSALVMHPVTRATDIYLRVGAQHWVAKDHTHGVGVLGGIGVQHRFTRPSRIAGEYRIQQRSTDGDKYGDAWIHGVVVQWRF